MFKCHPKCLSKQDLEDLIYLNKIERLGEFEAALQVP